MQSISPLFKHGSEVKLLDAMINGRRRIPEPPSSHDTLSTTVLGFPLGAALILLTICGISMFFSCLCRWKRIYRHISRRFGNSIGGASHQNTSEMNTEEVSLENPLGTKQCETLKPAVTLPVLMPGDEFPKYLAWPTAGPQDKPFIE